MTERKVVSLVKPTHPASDPDHVLEKAKGEYSSLFIIGYRKDDDTLDARSTLDLTPAETHWLLTKFLHKLTAGDYSNG